VRGGGRVGAVRGRSRCLLAWLMGLGDLVGFEFGSHSEVVVWTPGSFALQNLFLGVALQNLVGHGREI